MNEHMPMRLHVGVAVHSAEAVVVLTEHRLVMPSDPVASPRKVYDSLVHEVLRPSATVAAVADLLAVIAAEYAVEQPYFMIVPDRQGTSLHRTLVEDRRRSKDSSGYASAMRANGRHPFLSARTPHLVPWRGRDQQKMLDQLVATLSLNTLHVAPDATEREALVKALTAFDQEAHDDRFIPPLVAAVAASVTYPTHGAEPRALGKDGHVYVSARTAGQFGTHVAY